MSYKHGVYIDEVPTSLTPMRHVEGRMPVVIGTAPVEALDVKYINEPVICFTFDEFVEKLGWSEAPEYTLCEAADIFFRLYAVGPVVFINVYDPAIHVGGVGDVVNADIIGGVDGATGEKTGLELVNSVYPMFRKVPGQILCPGFSHEPAVGLYMSAKANAINGMFNALALCDIEVDYYTDAPAWKNTNTYTDKNMIVAVGKVLVGEKEHYLSTHFAALSMQVDNDNGDIPFVSASNKGLKVNGLKIGDEVVTLGVEQANYLNGEGIVTAINFDGGWKAWGNRTACYPSNTDPKDSFIPVRAFFNWLGRTLILSYWSRVDTPIRRRDIYNAIDSANVFLNGLASREIILGGRCSFLEAENPAVDIIDGVVRYHVYVTPPTPAREIDFALEYDPSYIADLF